MSAIHLLDNSITDLIAAGEVVERPSSVVKELVENSIDAGATKIIVEIYGGGSKKIKVSDNGFGMSSEDAPKAFLKHATSKIATKDDLYSIGTLGFRGEALCAISAVSKVTLTTKRREDLFATCVHLEGGKVISQEFTSYEDGTTIIVENLFFNTPARYKFLKSEPAETGAISSLMDCLAISHPNISFRYIINGSEKFFTTGSDNLLETIYILSGREFKEAMLPVNGSIPYKKGNISVSGFCGKPLFNRANRNKQYFFINGRYIKSRIIQTALENAYKSYIMVGRFPVCFLYITLDPSEVDINVHPSKLEVKFTDEKVIFSLVTNSVAAAITEDRSEQQFRFFEDFGKKDFIRKSSSAASSSTAPLTRKEAIAKIIDENLEKKTKPIVYSDWTMSPNETLKDDKNKSNSVSSNFELPNVADVLFSKKIEFRDYDVEIAVKTSDDNNEIPLSPDNNKNTPESLNGDVSELKTETASEAVSVEKSSDILSRSENNQESLTGENIPEYTVIGECFKTYVIVEKETEIAFIDKHALHERMNFEKLKSQKNIASQTLLTPVIFSTSSDNYAYICENTGRLGDYGFEVEDFGNNSVIIRAIPEMLDPTDAEALIERFSDIKTDSKKMADAELFDIFLYDVACKASIKAGKASSELELRTLIDTYYQNKDKLKYCPHGRPIEFIISKKDMEKQFKRIV